MFKRCLRFQCVKNTFTAYMTKSRLDNLSKPVRYTVTLQTCSLWSHKFKWDHLFKDGLRSWKILLENYSRWVQLSDYYWLSVLIVTWHGLTSIKPLYESQWDNTWFCGYKGNWGRGRGSGNAGKNVVYTHYFKLVLFVQEMRWRVRWRALCI